MRANSWSGILLANEKEFVAGARAAMLFCFCQPRISRIPRARPVKILAEQLQSGSPTLGGNETTGEPAARRASHRPTLLVLLAVVLPFVLSLLAGCGIVAKTGTASSTTSGPVQVTTTSVPSGMVQQSYSTTLAASGGTTPYSWSVTSGGLPSGLTLSASSGVIAGAPSQAGTFGFTVQVRDSSSSAQTATRALTLLVNSPGLQITTTGLPLGIVGTSYSATLSATGGTTPYSWSVTGSGQLPTGLTLSTTGTISGTPTVVGIFTFQVQVRDAAGLTSSSSFSINISSTSSCGGPLFYCSRTDLATVQLPSSIPNVGNLTGANTIITDPSFNNRIVRITDANSWSNVPGEPYETRTSGSGDENVFNTDSTLFSVQGARHGGMAGGPYSFNTTTMQAAKLYFSTDPTYHQGVDFWSYSQSQVGYNWESATPGPIVQSVDFTDRVNEPTAANGRIVTVADFSVARCTNGAANGSIWLTQGGVSKDDQTFAAGASQTGGTQGSSTAIYVLVFRKGLGCRMWNTGTGQVTGDWGTTGTVTINYSGGTVAGNLNEFSLHNVKLSKDGNWVVIIGTTCLSASCPAGTGPIFWDVGGLTATAANTTDTGGHWTEGYTHFVNQSGNTSDYRIRLHTSTALGTHLFNNSCDGWDTHPSWNQVDTNDSVPFFSQTVPLFTPTDNGFMNPFCGPWEDEIDGFATDGSGTVWRFAHSFATNCADPCIFDVKNGVGSVSQDGRFFAFSSDWGGTLGSEGNTSSCTLSGTVNGTNCRGDVFIVELK
jgi:putative Ig domain-containing protein